MLETVKVHVGELRVGMFVSKLDRDWLDTPFIMQGFVIEDPEDIEIVAEYCEYVWVDTRQKSIREQDNNPLPTASQRPPLPPPECSVQEEHKRAYKAFRSARRITSSVLDEIRLGAAVDSDEAKDVVNEVVHSVIRHPDAMLWLSKIRGERTYTSDHCLNVCVLAVAFGRHLGIEGEDLERLGLCGLLHDVGKMRVPIEIVDKPARLTPKEFSLMKAHTVHGRNLLMTTKNLFPGAVDVAYSHHERIDGKGYPRKLKGASITAYSRIIGIVDAYDAMTANRCYSRAKTSTEALKEIYKGRGTQFDEEYALEFIKTIGLYPPGCLVELYSGNVGLVFESNSRRRHLPKVLLLLDEKKEHLEKEKVLDLSYIESGEISKRFLIKQVWPDGSFGLHLSKYQDRGLTLKF